MVEMTGVRLQRYPQTCILQKFRRPSQRHRRVELRQTLVRIHHFLRSQPTRTRNRNTIFPCIIFDEGECLAEGAAVGEFLLEVQRIPQPVAALEQPQDPPQEPPLIGSQRGGAVAGEVLAEPDLAAAGGGESHQPRGGLEGAEPVAQPLHPNQRLLQQVQQLEQRQFLEVGQPHAESLGADAEEGGGGGLGEEGAVVDPDEGEFGFGAPVVEGELVLQLRRGQCYLGSLQILLAGFDLLGQQLARCAALQQPILPAPLPNPAHLERSHLILFIQHHAPHPEKPHPHPSHTPAHSPRPHLSLLAPPTFPQDINLSKNGELN